MDSKPAWASKTLWINVIALAASLFGAFGVDLGMDLTPEGQTSLVAGIMAVVNVALRFVTTEPVKLTPK